MRADGSRVSTFSFPNSGANAALASARSSRACTEGMSMISNIPVRFIRTSGARISRGAFVGGSLCFRVLHQDLDASGTSWPNYLSSIIKILWLPVWHLVPGFRFN